VPRLGASAPEQLLELAGLLDGWRRIMRRRSKKLLFNAGDFEGDDEAK